MNTRYETEVLLMLIAIQFTVLDMRIDDPRTPLLGLAAMFITAIVVLRFFAKILQN